MAKQTTPYVIKEAAIIFEKRHLGPRMLLYYRGIGPYLLENFTGYANAMSS